MAKTKKRLRSSERRQTTTTGCLSKTLWPDARGGVVYEDNWVDDARGYSEAELESRSPNQTPHGIIGHPPSTLSVTRFSRTPFGLYMGYDVVHAGYRLNLAWDELW